MNLEKRIQCQSQNCPNPYLGLSHAGLSRREEIFFGILILLISLLVIPIMFLEEMFLRPSERTSFKDKIQFLIDEIKIIWRDYF